MILELVTGNLLEADTEALVNAVNTEGVMGKGIALQFKKKYPDMFEAYQLACKDGQVQPGKMHVYEIREMINPRYIINFPTKRHWRSPSRIEDIKAGLSALVEEIRKRRIKSIALPALGCGNGGLDWSEVLPMIKSALTDLTDVRLLVIPARRLITRDIERRGLMELLRSGKQKMRIKLGRTRSIGTPRPRMSDEAFAQLREAFEDALAFERGARRDLHVTRIQAPRPPKYDKVCSPYQSSEEIRK